MENLKQFNVKLPAWLIAAVQRYISDMLEENTKKIPTSEVVGQALFYYLGPFNSLSWKQAVWKAKVDKAQVKLNKVIDGKDALVKLSSEDIAEIIRQLRDSVEEGEIWATTSSQQS